MADTSQLEWLGVKGNVELVRINRNGSATRQKFQLDLSQGASQCQEPTPARRRRGDRQPQWPGRGQRCDWGGRPAAHQPGEHLGPHQIGAVNSGAGEPGRRFQIDWVLVEELAIGPAPRAERHLDRLEAAGLKAVLTLCGPAEAELAPGLAERFCHQRCVLPDHRTGRMPELAELEAALAALAELHQRALDT